jgi:hypothetical protein
MELENEIRITEIDHAMSLVREVITEDWQIVPVERVYKLLDRLLDRRIELVEVD